MISVALCVYNGARFLPEQLASIAAQTQTVDELVVCDDRSTDNTREMLAEFGKTVSFPVHIHQNERQLGSTKNFEKCLQLCQGDIIFLCDQDDYWYPEKVAEQIQYLAENPTKQAVFSDGNLMDEQSGPIPGSIWQTIEFDAVGRQTWNAGRGYRMLFQGYVVTGATLAIRARALPRLLPFPDGIKTMIHDSWIALLLSLTDQIGFVDKPLIRYRRHASQQVGFGKAGPRITLAERFSRARAEKLVRIEKEWERLDMMHQLLAKKPGLPTERVADLAARRNHFFVRKQLSDNRLRRFIPVMAELLAGRYYDRQRHWWKTVLGDLLE
jgi:glycosyltransferase involved in cell wall biosynthesis